MQVFWKSPTSSTSTPSLLPSNLPKNNNRAPQLPPFLLPIIPTRCWQTQARTLPPLHPLSPLLLPPLHHPPISRIRHLCFAREENTLYLATAVVPPFLASFPPGPPISPSCPSFLHCLHPPLSCVRMSQVHLSALLSPDWRKGGGGEEGDDRQEKVKEAAKGLRWDGPLCQKWLLSSPWNDKQGF